MQMTPVKMSADVVSTYESAKSNFISEPVESKNGAVVLGTGSSRYRRLSPLRRCLMWQTLEMSAP